MYFCGKIHEGKQVNEIIHSVKSLILTPKVFWDNQKNSVAKPNNLFVSFLLPFILVAAFAVFAGELFKNSHFYIGFAALKAAREMALFSMQYFLAVFFTNQLMQTFGIEKNKPVAQKLVGYSLVPFLLVSVVTGLFQFLYVLDFLGLFSFYIFWIGAETLLDFPNNKKGSYILLTILVNFFVFSFISVILSKIIMAYF